jgi:hypothetical protein
MMAQAPVLPSASLGNEAKTVMAQAPILPSQPPPGGRPQPSPNSDQRTMIAQAPSVQVSPQTPQVGGGGNPNATMMLPDSAGVVAYNQQRAVEARADLGEKPSSAGPLFWLAWVVLGIGAGLGVHYYLVQRAMQ